LGIVADLFSRKEVGRSMESEINTSLVLDALLMALRHRRPEQTATVHSD
jgi:transposase InsO family protein